MVFLSCFTSPNVVHLIERKLLLNYLLLLSKSIIWICFDFTQAVFARTHTLTHTSLFSCNSVTYTWMSCHISWTQVPVHTLGPSNSIQPRCQLIFLHLFFKIKLLCKCAFENTYKRCLFCIKIPPLNDKIIHIHTFPFLSAHSFFSFNQFIAHQS